MTFFNNRDPKDRRRRIQPPDKEIIRWHVEYYQKGVSLKHISDRVGYTRQQISKYFKRLGLPISHQVEFRHYTPPDSDFTPSKARNP